MLLKLIATLLIAFFVLKYVFFSPKPVVDSSGTIVKAGDVLTFHRGGYFHIALAVDSWTAVHLTADQQDFTSVGLLGSAAGQTFAHVREDSILRIANNDEFYVTNDIWTKSENTIEDVVKRARSFVGETRTYNIVTSNCEHFVNDLIVGKASSQQVRAYLQWITYILGVSVLVVLVVKRRKKLLS